MKPGMREVVFSGLKWLALARIISQLVRWIVTFIVIRLLDPSDFGIVGLAASVMGLLELFSSFGLGAAIINSRDLDKRKLQIIFGMIVLVNASLAMVLWTIAPTAAAYYDMPEIKAVLQVSTAGFIISIFGVMSDAFLSRDMQFKHLALADVCGGIVGAGISLYMAYSGFGYWALVIGGLSISLTSTLVKIAARPLWILPIFRFGEGKKYLSFGGLIMGSIILRYLYVNMDVIIAAKSWTPETLGIYAVAVRIVVLPLNKVMPLIRQVAFPSYSMTQFDMEAVRGYMIKSTGLAMALCFPFFFGLSAISLPVIPLILGEAWSEATLPIMVLSLVIPFRMLLELFEPALNATGGASRVFLISLGILLIMLPTFVISMQWQVTGLSLGWLVIFPPLTAVACYRYCRAINLDFREIVAALRTPLLGSLVMFSIVQGLIAQLKEIITPVPLLMVSVLTGVLVYMAFYLIFDRQRWFQYLELTLRK